jgi:hypothetical protein
VPLDHKLATVLGRFTFGEFKSFLESIGRGHALRTEIEKMQADQFRQKIETWGKDYIALHSEQDQQADGELSLLQEFELDEESSSVQ